MSALPYQSLRIHIDHDSAVGHARRAMQAMAADAHVDDAIADRAALILNELAANLLRHAGGGDLLVQLGEDGLELVASDSGPGIANVTEAMRDGFSTAGTAGNGLGAVKRAATSFDISSKPGKGTIVAARVYSETKPVRFGALCVAKPGESVVGDGWGFREATNESLLVVADGLGHGPEAGRAAAIAVRIVLQSRTTDTLEQIAQAVHTALKATRGAAIAIARLDNNAGTLTFLGVGNIAATVFGTKRQSLASQNGTMGGMAPRLQRFSYPFERDAVLVAHSDGLHSRWSLDDQAGIYGRDPLVVAAAALREGQRGNDDATVLAIRGSAS